MTKDTPEGVCLQCGQSRETIEQRRYFCVIMSTGRDPEVSEEFPRHRYADWSDAALDRFGVAPEAYERYRRAAVLDFQWIPCEDRITGHLLATRSLYFWDILEGECMRWCDLPARQERERNLPWREELREMLREIESSVDDAALRAARRLGVYREYLALPVGV